MAVYWSGELTKLATQRRILRLCGETSGAIMAGGVDADELLERCERDALAIRRVDSSTESHDIKTLVQSAVDDMEQAHQSGGKLRGLATGFPDPDRLTGGRKRQQMVVIAARPAAGKTSLAMNIAKHVAVDFA